MLLPERFTHTLHQSDNSLSRELILGSLRTEGLELFLIVVTVKTDTLSKINSFVVVLSVFRVYKMISCWQMLWYEDNGLCLRVVPAAADRGCSLL